MNSSPLPNPADYLPIRLSVYPPIHLVSYSFSNDLAISLSSLNAKKINYFFIFFSIYLYIWIFFTIFARRIVNIWQHQWIKP